DVGLSSTGEPPLVRGRSALIVAATTDSALPELTMLSATSLVSKERSDLAVFAGNDVRLFPSNDSYVVGHLGPVGRTLWFLSSHPLMIVLLLVSAAAALAKLTTRAAARRAARRLG